MKIQVPKSILVLALAVLVLVSPATAADLKPEEAKALAQEAFVFGLPLVYIAGQADQLTNVAKPEGARSPMNQFSHYREFPDAKHNPIVGMNVDTLYSFGYLDLSAEPIVLTIPEMGDRYWIMQVIDAWNDVPAAPGARTVGGKGGNFAIVGPGWTGSLPEGVTEVRSDTALTMIGGRTYAAGKDDYAAVHALQDQYRLIPLSKWGTDYRPPESVPVKEGVDAKTPIPEQVFAMNADTFFGRLNALMVANPPRADDAPILARIAELGIAPGATFSTASMSPEVQAAIAEGMKAGQDEIRAQRPKMGTKTNGWQIARDLGRYGTNYAYRAAWTYFGVGGNLAEDAVYPKTEEDADGNKLSGGARYELHFTKEQIPPVDGFWSITMYDENSYLVDNPINRYALSSRDPMKYGEDGSLTIYIQRLSPGADKEANWLPASEDGMTLAMRLYWPKPAVVDGTWSPPKVQKIE